MSDSVLPMFSSRSFIVSGLTFRSLINLELIFVYCVRKGSSFILLEVVDQFSQHHLLKRFVFSPCMRQGAQDWCTGMTLRDEMGREVGRRVMLGNTCIPMVDSREWMAKTTTIL